MSKVRIAIKNAPLILRGIYEYNVASRFGPLPAREWMFPVTYRCNARCVMCNIWQQENVGELSNAEWRHVLDDPLFATVESVALTGGEPTLRADLPQLAELLTQKLPALRRMTLTTNALSVERVARHCAQLTDLCAARGVRFFVGVSLDGVGTTHDEMRGIPGAFERVSQALHELERLRPRGLRMGINCTLTGRNLHDAPRLQRWCAERGLPVNWIIASFAESYYANTESAAELGFGTAQREELAAFLQQLAAQKSLGNPAACFYADAARMLSQGAARRTPCVFQKDGFILDARGNLQYCMYSRVLGNVREQSARSIYFAPENLAHRQEVIARECRHCTITCFLELGLAKDACKYLNFLLRGARSERFSAEKVR
jgi:MoaA/NifB/PqqE/SkfB family radical SAM enzyme